MADPTTPVGDWLRRRYPPNDGATHYLGADGDPGCCAGPHPACTYDAGFREGAAAERAKLADRQQMVDEVKAELDDAFQFAGQDGSRHGYVTREWVQVLVATQAASAAAAEREACAQLADQVDAFYDAPCPDGDTDCVHQDTPFAALLRKDRP